MHRLSKGIPRLINQICDISLTYGFAEQSGFITTKLVAQAALDRSKGGILPLARIEELSALAALRKIPKRSIARLRSPSSPFRHIQDAPASKPAVHLRNSRLRSVGSPGSLYSKGVALRKEGRFREAIDMFELSGVRVHPIGSRLEHRLDSATRSYGRTMAAIEAFRTALNDESAPQKEVSISSIFSRGPSNRSADGRSVNPVPPHRQMNPKYKDAAYRAKELSSKPKHPKM